MSREREVALLAQRDAWREEAGRDDRRLWCRSRLERVEIGCCDEENGQPCGNKVKREGSDSLVAFALPF